jgi:hypothetical protein
MCPWPMGTRYHAKAFSTTWTLASARSTSRSIATPSPSLALTSSPASTSSAPLASFSGLLVCRLYGLLDGPWFTLHPNQEAGSPCSSLRWSTHETACSPPSMMSSPSHKGFSFPVPVTTAFTYCWAHLQWPSAPIDTYNRRRTSWRPSATPCSTKASSGRALLPSACPSCWLRSMVAPGDSASTTGPSTDAP